MSTCCRSLHSSDEASAITSFIQTSKLANHNQIYKGASHPFQHTLTETMSSDTLPKPKTRKRGMRENETYWEKTVRKCSAEPLVPIGGLVTAGILMGGLRSFATSNSKNSQNWMRARVIAQGCTILAVVLGSQFIKPNRPALYEEQMERKTEEEKLNGEWKADQN